MKKINFRAFETESGKLVLAGKSATNNEELVAQVGKNEDAFHTKAPGSPFVNIKGRSNARDREEAAVFCAKYSQTWRDKKSDVVVHQFKGKNIQKKKGMKVGTFGVKKIDKIIKVKKEDIEKW